MDKDLGREPRPVGEKNIAYTDSEGYRARGVVILDVDGNQTSDIDSYFVYKKDDDASPNYFGFQKANGAWYILRETLSAGDDTYVVAKGDSDIETNWTNRVALSYDTYENTF